MMGDEQLVAIRMTNYNFVKELATFTFIRENGSAAVIVIHRDTFRKLMKGEYDTDNSPEKATELQSSFKRTVIKEIKKNYDDWFEKEANRVCGEYLGGAK
jgi:hypothetical protein